MTGKKKFRTLVKRSLRRKENKSDAKRDVTMGKAARRLYGMGAAK